MRQSSVCVPGLTRAKWGLHQARSIVKSAPIAAESLLQELCDKVRVDVVATVCKHSNTISSVVDQLDSVFSSLSSVEGREAESLWDQLDCDLTVTLAQWYLLHTVLHSFIAHESAAISHQECATVFRDLLPSCDMAAWTVTELQVKRLVVSLRSVLHVSAQLCAQESNPLYFKSATVFVAFFQSTLSVCSNQRKLFTSACDELLAGTVTVLSRSTDGQEQFNETLSNLMSLMLFNGDAMVSELASISALDGFAAAALAPAPVALNFTLDPTTKELFSLDQRVYFHSKQGPGKGAKKQQYHDKLLQGLSADCAAAQGAAAIFDLYVQRSQAAHDQSSTTGDSSDSAAGYRKHVCRVIQVLAAILASPLAAPPADEDLLRYYTANLRAEIARASLRKALLLVLVRRLHSLPQHASLQRHVNFLFALFRRSLLSLHAFTLAINTATLLQSSEIEQVHFLLCEELECLGLLSDLDHHFIVENKAQVLALVEAQLHHPGSAERYYHYFDSARTSAQVQLGEAKKQLVLKMWRLFGSLRALDALCKSFVVLGGLDCPYQSTEKCFGQVSVVGSLRRRMRHSTIAYIMGAHTGEYDAIVVEALRGMPQGQWINVFHTLTKVAHLSLKAPVTKEGAGVAEEREREVWINTLQVLLLSYCLHIQHAHLLPQSSLKSGTDSFHQSVLPISFLFMCDLTLEPEGPLAPLYLRLATAWSIYMVKAYASRMGDLLVEGTIYQGSNVLATGSLVSLCAELAVPAIVAHRSTSSSNAQRVEALLYALQLLLNVQAKTSWATKDTAVKQCTAGVLSVCGVADSPGASATQPEDEYSSKALSELRVCEVLLSHLHIVAAVRSLRDQVYVAAVPGVQALAMHRALMLLGAPASASAGFAQMEAARARLSASLRNAVSVDCEVVQRLAGRVFSPPWAMLGSPALLVCAHKVVNQGEGSSDRGGLAVVVAKAAAYAALSELLHSSLVPANQLSSLVLTDTLHFLEQCVSGYAALGAGCHGRAVISAGAESALSLVRAWVAQTSASERQQRLGLSSLSALQTLVHTLQSLVQDDVFEASQTVLGDVLRLILGSGLRLAQARLSYRPSVRAALQGLYRDELCLAYASSDELRSDKGLATLAHRQQDLLELLRQALAKTAHKRGRLGARDWTPSVSSFVAVQQYSQCFDLVAALGTGQRPSDALLSVLACKLTFVTTARPNGRLAEQSYGLGLRLVQRALVGPGALRLLEAVACIASTAVRRWEPEAVAALVGAARTHICGLGGYDDLSTVTNVAAHVSRLLQRVGSGGGDVAAAVHLLCRPAMYTPCGACPVSPLLVSVVVASGLAGNGVAHPELFPAALDCLAAACSEVLASTPSRPSAGRKRAAEESGDGPCKVRVLCVVADRLQCVMQALCDGMDDKNRLSYKARGFIMANGRRLCQRALPILVTVLDALGSARLCGDDEAAPYLHDAAERLVMVMLGLCRGMLPAPAQAMPMLCACLGHALQQVQVSFSARRHLAEHLAALIVRVVAALAALTDLQSQRSTLLLTLIHALSGVLGTRAAAAAASTTGPPTKKLKAHSEDSFLRFAQDSLFPAYYPLLEKLSTKEKEKVFVQLPIEDRVLFSDMQEVYARNYKYKGY